MRWCVMVELVVLCWFVLVVLDWIGRVFFCCPAGELALRRERLPRDWAVLLGELFRCLCMPCTCLTVCLRVQATCGYDAGWTRVKRSKNAYCVGAFVAFVCACCFCYLLLWLCVCMCALQVALRNGAHAVRHMRARTKPRGRARAPLLLLVLSVVGVALGHPLAKSSKTIFPQTSPTV